LCVTSILASFADLVSLIGVAGIAIGGGVEFEAVARFVIVEKVVAS